MELIQTKVWPSVSSFFESSDANLNRTPERNADNWRKYQTYAAEGSDQAVARRLDFMRLAQRLNVSAEELRQAIFDSLDVVAVGDSNYVLEDETESAPLLPMTPQCMSSFNAAEQERVVLQTFPRRLASGDCHRQDYMVMLNNVADISASRQGSLLAEEPTVTLLSPQVPSVWSFHSTQLQLLPTPSLVDVSHGTSLCSGLSQQELSQLLRVQEDNLLPTRTYSDQLRTSNIPIEAALYGLKTGMQGYLVGSNEKQNLLHLPAPVRTQPRWVSALMPSRIKSLQLVSSHISAPDQPTVFYSRVQYSQPMVGWLILVLTLASFALMAPFSRMVVVPEEHRLVASLLVTGWRTSLAALAILPITVLWLWRYGLQPEQEIFLQCRSSWLAFLRCGVYQSLAGCGYNTALAFTTIPQAVLFANLHPLLIILFRLLSARTVATGELLGVLAGTVGMGFVVGGGMLGSEHSEGAGAESSAISYVDMARGDLAGFVTSISMCLFLTSTKQIRSQIPVHLFLLIQMAVGSLVTLSLATFLLHARLATDPWTGLFGFCHREWVPSLVIGGTLMLFGWLGASAVTKYLNPVVISTFLTLEPAVAVVFGVLMGVEAFPSWVTMIGGLIMFGATVLVSASSEDEDEGKLVPMLLDDAHGVPGEVRETLDQLARQQSLQESFAMER